MVTQLERDGIPHSLRVFDRFGLDHSIIDDIGTNRVVSSYPARSLRRLLGPSCVASMGSHCGVVVEHQAERYRQRAVLLC